MSGPISTSGSPPTRSRDAAPGAARLAWVGNQLDGRKPATPNWRDIFWGTGMRIVKLAALAAGLSLAAGAAQASVTLTFTGVVNAGSDGAGLFGTAGASLVGQAYTTVYVIDDSNLGSYPNAYYAAEGGVGRALPSPIISAAMTINGTTVDVGGDFYGYYSASNAIGHYNGLYYQTLSSYAIGVPNTQYVYNRCEDSRTTTIVARTCTTYSDGFFKLGDGGATFGNLTATGATTSDPVAFGVTYVPEPATWAMMIAGFGMIGGALRRRREVAA
jgi:hypothetical protein